MPRFLYKPTDLLEQFLLGYTQTLMSKTSDICIAICVFYSIFEQIYDICTKNCEMKLPLILEFTTCLLNCIVLSY